MKQHQSSASLRRTGHRSASSPLAPVHEHNHHKHHNQRTGNRTSIRLISLKAAAAVIFVLSSLSLAAALQLNNPQFKRRFFQKRITQSTPAGTSATKSNSGNKQARKPSFLLPLVRRNYRNTDTDIDTDCDTGTDCESHRDADSSNISNLHAHQGSNETSMKFGYSRMLSMTNLVRKASLSISSRQELRSSAVSFIPSATPTSTSTSTSNGTIAAITTIPKNNTDTPLAPQTIQQQTSLTSSATPGVAPTQQGNNKKRNKSPRQDWPVVTNVAQLRKAVLDDGHALKHVRLEPKFAADQAIEELLNHDVLQVLARRFNDPDSKPGNRTDDAHVALAMEGGGMRGCVSAGMAAAIASLGLTDAFDSIYGSSAGSVIGAYMISRQMCMDVYVDILPAAKQSFVCKKRLIRSLAKSAIALFLSQQSVSKSIVSQSSSIVEVPPFQDPGMNISFVLDGILEQDTGIRPLDLERLEQNDNLQKLRVASSCVNSDGVLESKCFGSKDFFAVNSKREKQRRLFDCLQASMTVPGATGPPVTINGNPHFDAFCTEPLPYRSAVASGATHVLVLCSRPEGWEPKTKQGVYEQGVAPLYFHSNKLPQVARYFERGGQQYIYAEDLLTLDEGKRAASHGNPIQVPPPDILYGLDEEQAKELNIKQKKDRSTWNKAHLLPLKVPVGTPELPTLEQDQQEVLKAVRAGYAAAFDLLVPALKLQDRVQNRSGTEVAQLVFPGQPTEPCSKTTLETKISVQGDSISEKVPSSSNLHVSLESKRAEKMLAENHHVDDDGLCPATSLLQSLPGFQDGRLGHLAKGLHDSKVAAATTATAKNPDC